MPSLHNAVSASCPGSCVWKWAFGSGACRGSWVFPTFFTRKCLSVMPLPGQSVCSLLHLPWQTEPSNVLLFFCLSHGKERGKKSQGNKKNTSSQEKEKAKQILPLKQRSQSSFISTSNLHWDFPICWRWKVHWILAEVQVLKHLLYFF